MRAVFAVLVGLAVALALIFGIELIGHTIWPPPAELDATDPEALAAYVGTLPFGALAIVLVAWIAGAFAGATVAGRLGRVRSGRPALVVGALILAATVANLAAIPHPTWVATAGLAGIVLATAAAVKGSRRHAAQRAGA